MKNISRDNFLYLENQLNKHYTFFDRIIKEFNITKHNVDLVAVLHVLPDMIPLANALGKIVDIKTIIPKPKSINKRVLHKVKDLPVRVDINKKNVKEYINSLESGKKIVLLDIGGYFAKIKAGNNDNILGIVEDTENGFQKYLKEEINFPFISVARSPLKYNEDVMVGQAISFSIETVLRKFNTVLNGLSAGVVGYGKIGSSVAKNLSNRNARVYVNDKSKIKLTQAFSDGNNIFDDKRDLLSNSDIICLATGNLSLCNEDYLHIKDGAWIFSVTSSDDEMDKNFLRENYREEKISDFVVKYIGDKNSFYLVNDGDTVNFLHGTTVGNFIALVHAEILVALDIILSGNFDKHLGHSKYELKDDIREKIADIWIGVFENLNK